jgi:hypothetical protein
MIMPNNLPTINLAGDREIAPIDKLMNWTLSVGRLIVIVTEIIAVLAFVYRFSLDEKLINLHSTIKQQRNIISALKNDEIKYRDLQDRIALASTFSTKAINANKTITDITNLIPSSVRVKNLTLSKNQIMMNVDVLSVSSLVELVDSFKGYDKTKSININNIENKPSVGLSVNITTTLK